MYIRIQSKFTASLRREYYLFEIYPLKKPVSFIVQI